MSRNAEGREPSQPDHQRSRGPSHFKSSHGDTRSADKPSHGDASRPSDKSSRHDSSCRHRSGAHRHKSKSDKYEGSRSSHPDKHSGEKRSRDKSGDKSREHKSGERHREHASGVQPSQRHHRAPATPPAEMSEKRRGKLPASPPGSHEGESWIVGLPPHIIKEFEHFMRYHLPGTLEPADPDHRSPTPDESGGTDVMAAQPAAPDVTVTVGQSEAHQEARDEVRDEAPGKDEDDDDIVIVKWEVDENGDIIRPKQEPEEEDELDPSDTEEEHEVIVISDDDGPGPGPKHRKPNHKPRQPATSLSAPAHRPPGVAPRRMGRGKRWTSEELLLLHSAALTDASNRFASAVPGRTANQCESTWRNTVYPAIVKFLQDRGT